jgi:hypothetical protein
MCTILALLELPVHSTGDLLGGWHLVVVYGVRGTLLMEFRL